MKKKTCQITCRLVDPLDWTRLTCWCQIPFAAQPTNQVNPIRIRRKSENRIGTTNRVEGPIFKLFFFHQLSETAEETIGCGITTVRLVSSGRHRNWVQVAIRPAEDEDLSLANFMCPA